MCAQFTIETRRRNLARQFGLIDPGDDAEINGRFLPYHTAPVVVRQDGRRVLRPMQFSLLPSWSKEKRVKFATHNARLFSRDERSGREVAVYEKPTWRGPFARRHCLVPVSGFIEPIYHGELAGNMVCFAPKDHGLLAAAGIWDEWTSRESGEIIDSFTILTDDPHPFVKSIGHDRTPIFLKPEAFETWLAAEGSPADSAALLREMKAVLELEVSVDRPLKAGWEKRAGKTDTRKENDGCGEGSRR
jgi:putative SOS response-associated peptidase YedK